MKHIPVLDIVFVIISAAFFLILTESGHGDLVSRYVFQYVLISYFIGKNIMKWQIKRQKDQAVE